VLSRMMAKKPAERFQRPQEIVQALLPWTEAPVPMPAARELADSFVRREAALATAADADATRRFANPSLPASGLDIAEAPTTITKPQEPGESSLVAPPRDESAGAAPTSPTYSEM